MPRLLPPDALDGPPVRARWAAILAGALAVTACGTDWAALWDTARGLVPDRTERVEWTAADFDTAFEAEPFPGDYEGIADPAGALNAQLRAEGVLLDLVWDATLTIAAVRVETYEDAYGTGHRLAIAVDSTTGDGIGCLNASLQTASTVAEDGTLLQFCNRADLHEPPGEPAGRWRPLDLFITQTANLDPAAHTDPGVDDTHTSTLVDYFGLGSETGDPYDSGLWPGWQSPQSYLAPECATEPGIYLGLDDLHLTDRYGDPASRGTELAHFGAPAYPVENRLVLPACTLVDSSFDGKTVLEPYLDPALTPLSSWTEFNASTAEPQPLRTAVAVDVRTCDTEPRTCSSDPTDPDDSGYSANHGTADAWLTELLRTGS
ncbi:hypothetical protein [Glycomyces sp. NPDC048151]|uniref:hypothetical protein n=1 Tax=Glycomyces sp. NPDC048151 TaxID=3364002 RepID=UPI00371E465A